MDNLGGQAKDEMRVRPSIDSSTPEKIMRIIKDVFASSETLGALQQLSKTRRIVAELFSVADQTSRSV